LCACSIHCCAMFFGSWEMCASKCMHANVCAADNEGARLCVLPAETRRGVRIGPQGKQAASADGAGDAFSGKVSAAAPVLVCALGAASRAIRAAAPLPSNVAISSAWSGAGGRAGLSGSASASYQRREYASAGTASHAPCADAPSSSSAPAPHGPLFPKHSASPGRCARPAAPARVQALYCRPAATGIPHREDALVSPAPRRGR
jgi:hypothetical protein